MRIVTLIENTVGSKPLKCEHGLSIYVETGKHKLLVDTGSSGAAIDNAKTMGVDVKNVDTVILSHGHYDHTGGVMRFVQENPKAKIYMQKKGGKDYYSSSGGTIHYIGVDKAILDLPNMNLIEGDLRIDEELSLFTGVTGRKYWPSGNRTLILRENGVDKQDTFDHEQYLVIKSEGKSLLLSGCAHNGILNILEKYREIYGGEPDVVISGFHMMKKTGYLKEDEEIIKDTAMELKKLKTIFYTGHCTSLAGFEIMKEIMKDQLNYIETGSEFIL